MLQELWSYFTTTGDINRYLDFKEYESMINNVKGVEIAKSIEEVE